MKAKNVSSMHGIQNIGYLAGRQRQVVDLLSLFQSSQIIGLFGDNGSGKSTISQKALLPELQKGFLGIGGKKWKTATIRPGVTPLENLSAGISSLLENHRKLRLEEEIELVEKMKSTNESLRRVTQQYFDRKTDCNYLLVIDNLEDLFHFKSTALDNKIWETNANSFIHNVSKCASSPEIPFYFLIILRSDFVPNIFKFQNFHELISKSQYSLPQFRKSEFQEVIFSLLKPYNVLISKDAVDFIYIELGKDLKNLKLINILLEKARELINENSEIEINYQVIQNININTLYEEKLESFYNSITESEKKLVEKTFKQITSSQKGSNQRNPIRIDQLLKVIGIQFYELKPIIDNINNKLDFALEINYPYQKRLISEDDTFIPDTATINIKNEQFIQHWPRLVEWIKQENESKETYIRLSETAKMFDQELTSYLKPPDLDYNFKWYEEKNPDELWANQFNGNYKKVISYLLTSKEKHQEDILKKETLQKEKIKRIRKTGFYIILGALFITIVITVFALNARKQETIANLARDKAESEKEKARLEKERADLLFTEAQSAMKEAQRSEKFALVEKLRADNQFEQANFLRKDAETKNKKISETLSSLDLKSAELELSVSELKVSDSLKGIATREAQNARAYQEALNKILSLRNKLQKGDYEIDDLNLLLSEIKSSYESYSIASQGFKGLVLPNNDLYQVLMTVRKTLVEREIISSLSNDIISAPNGLRKISISSSGILASGGDDGIILYSNKPIGNFPLEFKTYKIDNDRIRSLDFINENDLAIGTVNGLLYILRNKTGELSAINAGVKSKQIIEQIINTNDGLFILSKGEITKIDLKNENKITKITALNAERMFKFKTNKLLVTGKNSSDLLVLDISTFEWSSINSDLNKNKITASISSGEEIFFGMENGDVYACQTINSGKNLKIITKFVIPAHLSRITSLGYDSKTQNLFTASLDQKANIFDLSLANLGQNYIINNLIQIEGFKKWIWDFGIAKNGKETIILTVDENGDIKSWQTSTKVLYNEIFPKH
jgi:WD40 repeat protein